MTVAVYLREGKDLYPCIECQLVKTDLINKLLSFLAITLSPGVPETHEKRANSLTHSSLKYTDSPNCQSPSCYCLDLSQWGLVMRHMTASAEVTSHVRFYVHVMEERFKLFTSIWDNQFSAGIWSPLCLEGMLGVSPKWHKGWWDREQQMVREPFPWGHC